MSQLSLNLIDSQAFESSALSVKFLKQAHSLYSEEVAKQAKTVPKITISHDYLNKKGAIPPPITFTIGLSKRLSDEQTGHLFRLFSDYPYPNREKSGGVKDNFEQQALTYLRQNPQKAFFKKEDFQDRFSFRYAEAMIMKPSCVGCHNSHPKSPKKDWQVGDVRGVIEIAQPLDKFILQNKNGLKKIFLTLGGISCLGILGMALIIGKLRHANKELESKVKKRTAELESIAISDDLTQVANRRYFNEFLNQEWQKMMQQSKPLSLIICDIDHFKLYNDRYGHIGGDNCLIEVTQAIKNALSQTKGFLARYGGEEFVVVLPNRTLEGAKEIAELLRLSVVNRKIVHEASPTSNYVSLSLGVSSIIPSPLQSSDMLIKAADRALYTAKEKGRNCCVIEAI
ncbi:MAG: diguanylate cyclase domain-containing protein [Pleurocapsa sp.]